MSVLPSGRSKSSRSIHAVREMHENVTGKVLAGEAETFLNRLEGWKDKYSSNAGLKKTGHKKRVGGWGNCGRPTLQQVRSVVDRLVGDQLIGGADAPGVGQPVQVLDVTAAVVPNLRWIWRCREWTQR